jgi:hypothetical protein
LPRQPWQKRDVVRLRRVRAQGPRPRQETRPRKATPQGGPVNGIIYLVGLIVIVMAILSFIGIR